MLLVISSFEPDKEYCCHTSLFYFAHRTSALHQLRGWFVLTSAQEIQNPALTIGIWNPSSTDKQYGIQYLESGIPGVESRIQFFLWIPYMGRNRVLSGEDLYGIPGIRLQEDKFKVDRLQIIAKKYIYVSQLFISRMPKMRAISQLVSGYMLKFWNSATCWNSEIHDEILSKSRHYWDSHTNVQGPFWDYAIYQVNNLK